MNPQPELTDCEVARKLTPERWVALHVPRFADAAPAYVVYATFLNAALKEACRTIAPHAVIEVRAKGVPSFAEKILRKRDGYIDARKLLPPDPLVRLTDLCGGRVICQTASQVHDVCKFIEAAFVIDWPNSEDTSRRLKTAEFGYRSVHYIVQVDPARLLQAKITTAVPAVLAGLDAEVFGEQAASRPLKAEIQVRTLLEHASCDLGHDSIYKTQLKVPERIKRQYAALAAVLENADRDIDRVLSAVDAFKSNVGAWHDRSVVEKEIAHARVLLGLPTSQLPVADKIPVAVRAAQLALGMGDGNQAEDILKPFVNQRHAGIHRVLGQALTERYWDETNNPQFGIGVSHLERASKLDPQDAETIGLRAECAAHTENDLGARKLFAEAMSAQSNEPLTLIHYLEFEAAAANNNNPIKMAGPMLRAALVRARLQIEAQVNLPSAWSAVAMIHLMLNEPFAALNALAQLIHLCATSASADALTSSPSAQCAEARALLRLHKAMARMSGISNSLKGFAWFDRFLLLAVASRVNHQKARDEVDALASWNNGTHGQSVRPLFSSSSSIVILAGGCEPDLNDFMKGFGLLLDSACGQLRFDLISGGTTDGISGVAGSVADNSNGLIQAFGYMPSHPPRGAKEDTARFKQCFSSPGTDYTPLDPLQAWTDMIARSINPTTVKVLCYAPGEIARAECAIALALGAQVGLMLDPHLPNDRTLDTAEWEGFTNLLVLPMDAMTVRAFLQIAGRPISGADKTRLEPAARRAHEMYVKSATPLDASMQPWEDLTEVLKLSNYSQVAYWEKTLAEYGLGVHPLTPDDLKHEPLKMAAVLHSTPGRDPIRDLAEREHGRWNVERLACGWRYSPQKDVAKKLSPYLVPWDQVPEKIQQYDVDAIVELPEKLRKANMELYRIDPAAKKS